MPGGRPPAREPGRLPASSWRWNPILPYRPKRVQFSRGFLGRAASQSCRRGDGFWAVDDGAGDDDYAGPYAPSPSRNYGYFLVIMAHTLGMFGLSFPVGWLVDRLGRTKMILSGSLILMAACLLAPLSAEVCWLIVALFLLGLGWNCFNSSRGYSYPLIKYLKTREVYRGYECIKA
ncbi:MAG: hypothetical protein DPW09_22355 [Anaerolineae bacterium]|nr:hypothetical protein [Anaerolineae bacterium]